MKNWLLLILVKIVLVVLLSFFFLFLFSVGLARQEVRECERWNQWAQEYPDFYFTDAERAQCAAHGL